MKAAKDSKTTFSFPDTGSKVSAGECSLAPDH